MVSGSLSFQLFKAAGTLWKGIKNILRKPCFRLRVAEIGWSGCCKCKLCRMRRTRQFATSQGFQEPKPMAKALALNVSLESNVADNEL